MPKRHDNDHQREDNAESRERKCNQPLTYIYAVDDVIQSALPSYWQKREEKYFHISFPIFWCSRSYTCFGSAINSIDSANMRVNVEISYMIRKESGVDPLIMERTCSVIAMDYEFRIMRCEPEFTMPIRKLKNPF